MMKVDENVIARDVAVEGRLQVTQQLVGVEDFVGGKFAGVENDHLPAKLVVTGHLENPELGHVIELFRASCATELHPAVNLQSTCTRNFKYLADMGVPELLVIIQSPTWRRG